MIHVCKFPFSTSVIVIKSKEKLSDKDANNISIFLKTYQAELNHNNISSSAYKFNESQVGLPVLVKKEFVDFLQLNIKVTLDKTLNITTLLGGFDKPEDIIINHEGSSVIKMNELVIDSSFLRNYYIFDLLNKYLDNELKIKNYLINYDNLVFVARGSDVWEVEINSDINYSDKQVLSLKNEVVIIENYESIDNPRSSKFAQIETPIDAWQILFQGQSILNSKLKSFNMPRYTLPSELQTYSNKTGEDFIIIDSKGEFHNFAARQ
jgi:hypothetical protein